MPYGTMSNETHVALQSQGFEPVQLNDGPGSTRVDVVVGGALDESFNINDSYLPADIAEAVATPLRNNSELDDWSVDVYDETAEPPELIHTVTP